MPNNTADLVALTQYLEHASTALVMKLQMSVDEAAERLAFLLDYATLSRKFLGRLMKFASNHEGRSATVRKTSSYWTTIF